MSDKYLIKSGLEGVQEKINVEIDKTFSDKAPDIRQFLVRFAEDNSLSLPDELKDDKKLFEVLKLADLIEFRATADGFSIVTEDGESIVTEKGHSLITETTYPEFILTELIKIGEILNARSSDIKLKENRSIGGIKSAEIRHEKSRKYKKLAIEMYESGVFGVNKSHASRKITRKLCIEYKVDYSERTIESWFNKKSIRSK